MQAVKQTHPVFQGLPVVSIVVPFWVYPLASLIYIWFSQNKELQWRPKVNEAQNP